MFWLLAQGLLDGDQPVVTSPPRGGSVPYDLRGQYPRQEVPRIAQIAVVKPAGQIVDSAPAPVRDSTAEDARAHLTQALRNLEQLQALNPGRIEPAQLQRAKEALASFAVNAPSELQAINATEDGIIVFMLAMLI